LEQEVESALINTKPSLEFPAKATLRLQWDRELQTGRIAMEPTEVVLEGTLRPDGTLELDQKPDLPPGRVAVRVQPLVHLPEGDPFFDMLREIWAVREQAGLAPRSAAEIEAQRRQLREESDQEVLEAGRLQQEPRQWREQPPPPAGGRA